MSDVERCLICGRMIPEGRQVCPVCEKKELQPVGHALWIYHDGGHCQCSSCRRYFRDVCDDDNYDYYCRHCGAIMEGIIRYQEGDSE